MSHSGTTTTTTTTHLPFQFILYVRPELEQHIIDLVHPNAKIVVQSVHKLPRPLPSFLTGTPILAEPKRSRIWRGQKEVMEQLANYNEFLFFHVPEWYRPNVSSPMFPISPDSLPAPTATPTSILPPPQILAPVPMPPPPPATTTTPPPMPIPTTTPPPIITPVLSTQQQPLQSTTSAPVLAMTPVDINGTPNDKLPPPLPPINDYRIKGAPQSSMTMPTAATPMIPIPSPSDTPAEPAPMPATRRFYSTRTNPMPSRPMATTGPT